MKKKYSFFSFPKKNRGKLRKDIYKIVYKIEYTGKKYLFKKKKYFQKKFREIL